MLAAAVEAGLLVTAGVEAGAGLLVPRRDGGQLVAERDGGLLSPEGMAACWSPEGMAVRWCKKDTRIAGEHSSNQFRVSSICSAP